jgi:5-deoxy-glucuronate isomerase
MEPMQSLPRDPKQMIFSGTASHTGRHVSLSPANSQLRHLNYGRIRLDAETPRVEFDTGRQETALICMKGDRGCTVTVDGVPHLMALHDGIYIPRGSAVAVAANGGEVDLVECSAEVEGVYPLQLVRYAELVKDPSLRFRAGGAATTRDLNIVIGKNVQAGRILAGFTRSQPGNWTSWPPHEHTELLEEVYVYFDMPAPAFGIQMVYTQPDNPEFIGVVRDGDAVIMPSGYHPNVAAPGHSINFIWMMAAHRETTDRQFGVVNVQPEFDQAGTGLEASQKVAAPAPAPTPGKPGPTGAGSDA